MVLFFFLLFSAIGVKFENWELITAYIVIYIVTVHIIYGILSTQEKEELPLTYEERQLETYNSMYRYGCICMHVYILKFIKINLGLLKMMLEYPHCITIQVYGTKY